MAKEDLGEDDEAMPVVGIESNADNDEKQERSRSETELDETAQEEAMEKLRREREARAQALTLEIVGDLPYAEVKPPENVLFVCKLNPVTEDEDLNLIFSRFGKILSCEVIRDKRTNDSLQYAFIEFEHQKDCEQAYFKMQGVLIDDHRIHVDFSQSVSRLSDTWRNATNSKRAKEGGGFGGVSNLEKKQMKSAADETERQIEIIDQAIIREVGAPREKPTTNVHQPGETKGRERMVVGAIVEKNMKSATGDGSSETSMAILIYTLSFRRRDLILSNGVAFDSSALALEHS